MKGGRKNSGRKNEPEQWPALSDDWDTERGKAIGTHVIAIIQVIDGDFAVVEKGLFDVAQPERLHVKVVVFLRSADTES
jgi:hypothetical protein